MDNNTLEAAAKDQTPETSSELRDQSRALITKQAEQIAKLREVAKPFLKYAIHKNELGESSVLIGVTVAEIRMLNKTLLDMEHENENESAS